MFCMLLEIIAAGRWLFVLLYLPLPQHHHPEWMHGKLKVLNKWTERLFWHPMGGCMQFRPSWADL